MKGSRVNYCFDGATPVSAAFLANRYMLYTLERGYDNVYELADREGDVYVYKNNYSVPLGYMITETDNTELDPLFVSAAYMRENIHEDSGEDNDLNPIEKQNNLVHKLGIPENVFLPVEISSDGSKADFHVTEDAHYYAYTTNTKIDTVKIEYESTSKTFNQINKKFILDLGYHNAGNTINLNSENNESLDLTVYKMDTSALDKFIARLREQTFTVSNYDETSLTGTIDVTTEGHLVLSVPYEPSWTLYVDGRKTNMDVFEETFISVYLSEGQHTIELKYFPKGFIPGILVSIISIGAFAAICMIQKKTKQSKEN